MKEEPLPSKAYLLPVIVALAALAAWEGLSALNLFPSSVFPSPLAVMRGFVEELKGGRLFDDVVASLFRVATGFALAVVLGCPRGLWIGHHTRARVALLPAVNFFRNLSPLAWIPFAVLWFGVGDSPAIFLIFMASFFPIVLSTSAAVANIPAVYFRVAQDFGF